MRNIARSFSALLLGVLPLLSIEPAMAWDGEVTGKISRIDVASPANSNGFRVYLANSPALCNSASTWAYVNEADSNYKVFVATLIAAKTASQTVTIYSTKDAGTGYCHIGYITVQ